MPLALTPQQEADLRIYEALLRKWQKTINLVSSSTLEDLWTRHFLDSAQLLDFVPDARTWIDLGSGAGFPGLVVAILLKGRDATRIDLVESDSRKAAFLRTVSRETGTSAKIHTGRIESVLSTLPVPHVISARALAPLPKLLEWAGEKINLGAIGLFPKGQDVDAELNIGANYSRFSLEKLPSRTDSKSSIVKVTRA
jgi:16S rRNA (guanine527-N7)-methyltransferase